MERQLNLFVPSFSSLSGPSVVVGLSILLLLGLPTAAGQGGNGWSGAGDGDDGSSPGDDWGYRDIVGPAGANMVDHLMGSGAHEDIDTWSDLVEEAESEYDRLREKHDEDMTRILKEDMVDVTWNLMNASSDDFWVDLETSEQAEIVDTQAKLASSSILPSQSPILEGYESVSNDDTSSSLLARLLVNTANDVCKHWEGFVSYDYHEPTTGYYVGSSTVCSDVVPVVLSVVVPALFTAGTTVAGVQEAGEEAVSGTSEPMQSGDGNGTGSDWKDEYDITQPVSEDPDNDNASIVVEYQWDTIPVNETEDPVDGTQTHENARDYHGGNLTDGLEIVYWSEYMDQTLDQRTAQKVGFDTSDLTTVIFDEFENDTKHRTVQYNTTISWYELVETLNNQTDLAWRHPGVWLDTDGDGVPNIKDADSDGDRLMDGESLVLEVENDAYEEGDDKRYYCFADEAEEIMSTFRSDEPLRPLPRVQSRLPRVRDRQRHTRSHLPWRAPPWDLPPIRDQHVPLHAPRE